MTTLDVIREGATLGTPAHDDPDVKPWTEDDVLAQLWRHFASQSWAPIPQVTVAHKDLPDTADWRTLGPAERIAASTDRRIDMLLARTPRKTDVGRIETLAIEVKVTRADFLNDVKHPEKQAPWRKAATRHAYAVPAGLVRPDEVPDGSGLLYVRRPTTRAGWGEVEWAVRAPYRKGHAPALPGRASLALLHRTAVLEARTRGWQGSAASAGTEQEVRAALAAAQKAAEKDARRAERAEEQVGAWKAAYALAAPDGLPCRWCGNGIKPLNPERGWFRRWRHIDNAHDGPCEVAQEHAAEVEARAAYAAADDTERARQVRSVHAMHRDRYNPAVETEPWRAYLAGGNRYDGALWAPLDPAPADALPATT